MFLFGIMVFVVIVMYFSTKYLGKYQDGILYLVTIPNWAYESLEINKIEKEYHKQRTITLIISLVILLPILLIKNNWIILYYSIILWVVIILSTLPLRNARKELLEVKEKNNWIVDKQQYIKVDLSLSSYMEKHPFSLKRYLIVLLVDFISLGLMIYFKSDNQMYLFMFMQFIVLIGGIIFIKRIPNKALCSKTAVNITVNILRRDTFHHCFFSLILIDSLFNLVLQLFLVNQLSFIIILLTIFISIINICLVLFKINNYNQKKRELLLYYDKTEYLLNNDACWSIGLFGPKYYNKNDPHTLVSIPNGTQLVFNSAKNSYKIIISLIFGSVVLLLVWLFGYPYYLDYNHKLVDLSINQHIINVDSNFYQFSIDIDDINKVELTDDLGNGIRTNGTDTYVYCKGNCTYDKYGECIVYLASLHHSYIVLYTDNMTYIINDDDTTNTKAIYEEILEVKENDN